MAISSTICCARFKSPLRCLCRAFFQSRNRWREKARKYRETINHLRDQLQNARQQQRQMAQRLHRAERQVEEIQPNVDASKHLLEQSPMPGHQFSAEMISLCCQLSNLIGFRATPKVLRCIAEAFGLTWKLPTRDTVRNWNCRNGVAILRQSEKTDDWVWMIDHSVQLGKMFALVVLGIRISQIPGDRPLRRQDMTPLAVLPTDSRNKQEVGRQLLEVANRCGVPLAVLCDGACELHEGVRYLEKVGFQGVCIDDMKHKVSNLLKKTLGRDERFAAFEAKLGKTTAAIQQTELDHLLPPRKKQKCRFMNFGRLIDWATMVECQLNAPATPERVSEKLGWLREFSEELGDWRECRDQIGCVLSQANAEGVYHGASDMLEKQLCDLPASSPLSQHLHQEMILFYQSNEAKLLSLGDKRLRLPCSTEVLESAFGSFKMIQRYHNRGTFTSLLAVFATLFDSCDAKKIAERFSLICNRDLKAWLVENGLTNSSQSRRTLAYRQAANPV